MQNTQIGKKNNSYDNSKISNKLITKKPNCINIKTIGRLNFGDCINKLFWEKITGKKNHK